MDQDLIKKMMATSEFGEDVLQNPQDIAYWPSRNALAVADDSNGLLVFSAESPKHQLLQHIRSCADACSVCYNAVEKCLVVSVTKAVSAGDDAPGEFHFYNHDYKLIRTVVGPSTTQPPKVKYGYNRWVACDPVRGDLWVSAGDNQIAALWRYSLKENEWRTVWQGTGCLDRPSFLPAKDGDGGTQLNLIAIRWTESPGNWSIERWTVDGKTLKVVSQKRLDYKETEIAEPWSSTVDLETGYIYTFDYKSGAIQHLSPPNYNKVGDVVGMTKAGQYAAIDTHGEYVFVASSDERMVRTFRKRR